MGEAQSLELESEIRVRAVNMTSAMVPFVQECLARNRAPGIPAAKVLGPGLGLGYRWRGGVQKQ